MTMTMNTDDFVNDITEEHIRQSNLIEGVKDPKEIIQSMMAWNFLKDEPKITEEIVLTVHNLIMINLMPRVKGGAGSYRVVNVTVGGRHCPHFNEVPRLTRQWLAEMQHFDIRKPPMDMHIKFEQIHPFVDGNGRTGRMLLWWHEIKCGLKPTLITYDDRWTYYELFESKHFYP